MPRHRNSQKRIYIPGAAYFCTTNTYMRYAWFEEPLLREVLIAEIKISQQAYGFEFFGCAIMPDHLHVIFKPGETGTYSDIMKSIKKQSSHEMNRVLGNVPMRTNPENTKPFSRHETQSSSIRAELHLKSICDHDVFIRETRKKYIEKHGATNPPMRFKWHKSFHDHYIRCADDFMKHLRYIEKQPVHHGVEGTVYINAQHYEGEKPFSRLHIVETGKGDRSENVRESRIELIARAVGDDVHISRF